MNKIILICLLIIFSSLSAQDFSCNYYAYINHASGEKKLFTKSELDNAQPFNFTLDSNTLLVDLPSGNKEKFVFKDIKGGQKRYFSHNNIFLRTLTSSTTGDILVNKRGDTMWFMDTNFNGKLMTTVFICR